MDHSDYVYMHITKLLSSSTMLKEQCGESYLDLPLKIFIRFCCTVGLNHFCHIRESVRFLALHFEERWLTN